MSASLIRVLLVDDDVDDQEIFCMALRKVDQTAVCECAISGENALSLLNNHPHFTPSIIFIDINMPRMNGIECLREIKKIARLHHIPVHMISTSADRHIQAQSMASGANGFIKKTVGLADLQNKLSELVLPLKKVT